MLTENDLAWFAARLAIALHETNREYLMGIHNLREELKDIPGGREMVMGYLDGGRTQIYCIGEHEIKFDGARIVSASDIRDALESKKKLFLSTP